MFAKSIRWRLLAWHGLILAVVVAGFGFTAYQLEYAQRLRRIDNELQQRSSLLIGAVRPLPPKGGAPTPDSRPRERPGPDRHSAGPPPEEDSSADSELRFPPNIAAQFDTSVTNASYYIVWLSDGRLQTRSANAPDDAPVPQREGADQWQSARTRGPLREFIRFTPLDRCVLVGRSIGADLVELRRLGWLLVLAGATVLALGLAGGWWVASRAMRPIEDISATAAKISTGDLSQRVNTADTDNELGRLAGVLNSTFARLESAFAQQKQFTADAAHELRTPLAVVISEAQTTLARERTAAEYRETVEACLDTAQQMRRLTESLLELARFDAGPNRLQCAPLDLAEAARACVQLIHPLADPRGIRLVLNLAPAEARGDAELLNRVITNVLTNAIHYNKPKGEVRVSTRSENGAAVLTVADTGQGVTPEDLPHIFERFFRADKSRSRANGRAGLGLAICKAIMDAHGGSIEVASEPGEGTAFAVHLPATVM